MGDVVSLVEKAQQTIDQDEAKKTQERMAKGTFGLDDFLSTMDSFRKMGSMKSILKMIPGVGQMLKEVDIPEEELNRMRGIVHSMTPKERRNPDLMRPRVAVESRVVPAAEQQDVSGLVKQFGMMRPMMKQMAGMSMGGRLRATQAMARMGMGGGDDAQGQEGVHQVQPAPRRQEETPSAAVVSTLFLGQCRVCHCS